MHKSRAVPERLCRDRRVLPFRNGVVFAARTNSTARSWGCCAVRQQSASLTDPSGRSRLGHGP
jgi:hypothetical protein